MKTVGLMVEFPGGNPSKTTRGFLASPDPEVECPAVIVIHEIWGLVPHIKDVATRVASEGYFSLAIDLFDGNTVSQLDEGYKMRGTFTEEKIMGDLKGGFDYLCGLGRVEPKRIGSVGFCMGGGLSLLFACRNPKLAAAVVFYGRNPSPIDSVKEIRCPVLGNYAGDDRAISEADIRLLEQTLARYGKTFDFKIYPNCPHAFFNDTRESYRPEAARDAWQRTMGFFGKYLLEKKDPPNE